MVDVALNITGSTVQKMPQASEQVDSNKKNATQDLGSNTDSTSKNTLQSSELLNRIKAITENGTYSVQFETDSATGRMVVKIVNSQTQKVIRQIPAESILGIDHALTEFAGNFVNNKA